MDILTLVHSSKNKFLRQIFNLESAETKLGRGTIRQAKTSSQLFKVGSGTLLGLLGVSPLRTMGSDRCVWRKNNLPTSGCQMPAAHSQVPVK